MLEAIVCKARQQALPNANGSTLHAELRELFLQFLLSDMRPCYPPSIEIPGDLRPGGAARWSAAFSDVRLRAAHLGLMCGWQSSSSRDLGTFA